MASHVVVIDSAARRHNVKTTPSKHLSDVLQEACAKFGLKPEQYGLKHNNKLLDLSLTMRLSSLTSGAKLNLIQSSRSPAVIAVALQLSDGSRMTDKVPSNTSFWHLLRRFEESNPARPNLTQRATPLTSNPAGTGAGRLCYEMPLIRVMDRELASFTDLQKTLGQLGLNTGSALLHLSFQNTHQPLEEAMAEITQFFHSRGSPTAAPGAQAGSAGALQSTPHPEAAADDTAAPAVPGAEASMEDHDMIEAPAETAKEGELGLESKPPTTEHAQGTGAADPATIVSGPSNVISIFAPSTNSTPSAAQTPHNPADYVPTVEHAKSHQARLTRSSQNTRLKSDRDIEADKHDRAEKLAATSVVTVRIRFPDTSMAQREFGHDATISSLYETCRQLMHSGAAEPFSLRYTDEKGAMAVLKDDNSGPGKKLIEGLEWQGRVLVTVVWEEAASAQARNGPSLKDSYRRQAQELKVAALVDGGAGGPGEVVAGGKDGRDAGKSRGGDKEMRLKKLLGGLSKKK